jgi:cytidylate kinase
MIVALDGPAGSGKGTIGRRLADRYGFAYLDTGALYRAVARDALAAGVPVDGQAEHDAALAAIASRVDMAGLDDPTLRTQEIGVAASMVARLQAVRAALLHIQRDFAHHPPGGRSGAVLDGRDIGTVVCPDADVKIFLTATPKARAIRRGAQLRAAGEDVDPAALLTEILERDARDTQRAAAPMKAAADATLLDTTSLDIDAAFEAARGLVEAAMARTRGDAAKP